MPRRWVGAALFSFVGGLLLLASGTGAVYPEHPPAGYTGGFEEPTCRRCHFDRPLNAPGGSLTLDGAPAFYTAGARYLITVGLAKGGMRRGGFQVAARFAAGTYAGQQAGLLGPVDDRVEIVRDDSSAVRYAHHTKAGTVLTAPDTARWTFAWTSPSFPDGDVVFHVAANAANDDASEFGDFIYVEQRLSKVEAGRK
ncbi:MAG: choice-of-anchor V domain-containing protein [Rhodothermales bacterium]